MGYPCQSKRLNVTKFVSVTSSKCYDIYSQCLLPQNTECDQDRIQVTVYCSCVMSLCNVKYKWGYHLCPMDTFFYLFIRNHCLKTFICNLRNVYAQYIALNQSRLHKYLPFLLNYKYQKLGFPPHQLYFLKLNICHVLLSYVYTFLLMFFFLMNWFRRRMTQETKYENTQQ